MRKRLNISLVVNSLDVGGLEKVVISLINKLDRKRFGVSLICLQGAGRLIDEIQLPADQILVLDKSKARHVGPISFSPSLLVEIRRFLTRNRVDIVHAHNLAPLVYGGIGARLGLRRPLFIYSEHNQVYDASESDKRKFPYYLRLCDHIVAVSDDLRRTLTREFDVNKPIHVLYNGINEERFKELDGAPVRADLGVGVDDLLVGTCVRITEQKGLTYLVQAAPRIIEKIPNVKFAIVGDGPLLEDLKRQSRDAGLGEHVLFPGYRRDVPELISSFDLYALPSLWEGLPLALLEALAIGKPIVATRVGGNAEIVEDGVNGFIVEPRNPAALADAIVRALTDDDFKASVREVNKAKFMEQFREDVMVRNHAKLYERLATSDKTLNRRGRSAVG